MYSEKSTEVEVTPLRAYFLFLLIVLQGFLLTSLVGLPLLETIKDDTSTKLESLK